MDALDGAGEEDGDAGDDDTAVTGKVGAGAGDVDTVVTCNAVAGVGDVDPAVTGSALAVMSSVVSSLVVGGGLVFQRGPAGRPRALPLLPRPRPPLG